MKHKNQDLGEQILAAIKTAIDDFVLWNDENLSYEQQKNKIQTSLYHYTDGRGIKGILESQTIWFTNYRQLNDPSEVIHGIEMAHDVIGKLSSGNDHRVLGFANFLRNMFLEENFSERLQFFIASFSDDADNLGQWRAYADNGRGYAIGFAPSFFQVVDKESRRPDENVFVGRVIYEIDDVASRHHNVIDEAMAIFIRTINANPELLKIQSNVNLFMNEFARTIIASPLIWNCLTSKHPAYRSEKEVRLVILGTRRDLMPYIKTRLRGNEIVPYIPHEFPAFTDKNIVEIVLGPSSPKNAEQSIRTMLSSLGADPNIEIRRSDIPYRAL